MLKKLRIYRLLTLSLYLGVPLVCWPTLGGAQSPPPQSNTIASQKADTITFDEERAFQYLQSIVGFGQRFYGAPQRAEAIKKLTEQFKQAGMMQTQLQQFTQEESKSKQSYHLTNIIARLYPERPIRVILGSHWDTRLWAEEDHDPSRHNHPISGANDGSSGLAVLLEVAQQLKSLNLLNIGVDIVFFDGEEFGRPGSNNYCVGSKYFTAHIKEFYPQRLPLSVIIIDMVGDKDLAFPPEASSVRKSLTLTRLIWSEALRLKLPAFMLGLGQGLPPGKFAPKSRWIVDDHSPFHDLNIPATLIIDLDYPHWHTHQDTMDKVSAQSLKQTGLAILASLKKLDVLNK